MVTWIPPGNSAQPEPQINWQRCDQGHHQGHCDGHAQRFQHPRPLDFQRGGDVIGGDDVITADIITADVITAY